MGISSLSTLNDIEAEVQAQAREETNPSNNTPTKWGKSRLEMESTKAKLEQIT